jgi:hypothetical protein
VAEAVSGVEEELGFRFPGPENRDQRIEISGESTAVSHWLLAFSC